MTDEDRLFLSLRDPILKFLKRKLTYKLTHEVGIYTQPVYDIEEDLYHDSYIVYRNILAKNDYILGKTITSEHLTNYIWRIVISRLMNFFNKRSKNAYFEKFNGFSMDYLKISFSDLDNSYTDIFERFIPNYFTENKLLLDMHSLKNYIKEDVKSTNVVYNKSIQQQTKESSKVLNVLNLLNEGYNQKEISKLLGFNVHIMFYKIKNSAKKFKNENT